MYDPKKSTATNRVATTNTGNVAAAAYLGYANYEVRVNKGRYYIRQNEDTGYIQDNYKVTNRLKLNLGLRWQFTPYPSDKYNIFSSFDPKNMAIVMGQDFATLYRVGATTPALVSALTAAGAKFETPQQAGLPNKMVYNNYHDIGPHVGFAYRGFDGPKEFVIRGGLSENFYWQPAYGWNDTHAEQRAVCRLLPELCAHGGTAIARPPAELWAGQRSHRSSPGRTAPTWSTSIIRPESRSAKMPSAPPTSIPHQPSSRVWDWNLTVEKQIMPETLLRVAYVGNHSTHLDSYDQTQLSDSGLRLGDDQTHFAADRRQCQRGETAVERHDLSLRRPERIREGRLGLVERHSVRGRTPFFERRRLPVDVHVYQLQQGREPWLVLRLVGHAGELVPAQHRPGRLQAAACGCCSTRATPRSRNTKSGGTGSWTCRSARGSSSARTPTAY